MASHLLIIGGGQAAVQAIHSLRQQGFDGAITLIGGERFLPYQRPPLSKKYLAGELPRERLELRPAEWFRERDVTLELGVRAMEIEPTPQRVRLDDGRILRYDSLLLATGSRVRRLTMPGGELAGVHYLRTIGDVDAIAPALQPGKRLVLVGAGYIGLEVAAIAVQRGLDVTVLEATDRIMGRVVGPEVGEFYQRYHTARGVHLRCGAAVARFVGDGRVTAVETANGDGYACDLVVAGIGVEPETELAAAAGLACENGVVVDTCARTEDPRITAAGDCTCHPHPLADGRVRLESVQNAIEQAKAAAASILEAPRPYEEVPWFWSDQYDLKLQIAGLARGHDATVIRGDLSSASFAVFYLREGRLIAVEAVNSPREFMFARKAIAAGLAPSAAQLSDPGTDLLKLVPG